MKDGRTLEVQPQVAPTKCECECTLPMRGDPGLTGCREGYNRATYSTESTASVELASVAGGATATKPEALELWAGGEEGRGLEVAPCSWARGCLRLPPHTGLVVEKD